MLGSHLQTPSCHCQIQVCVGHRRTQVAPHVIAVALGLAGLRRSLPYVFPSRVRLQTGPLPHLVGLDATILIGKGGVQSPLPSLRLEPACPEAHRTSFVYVGYGHGYYRARRQWPLELRCIRCLLPHVPRRYRRGFLKVRRTLEGEYSTAYGEVGLRQLPAQRPLNGVTVLVGRGEGRDRTGAVLGVALRRMPGRRPQARRGLPATARER